MVRWDTPAKIEQCTLWNLVMKVGAGDSADGQGGEGLYLGPREARCNPKP